MSNNLRNNHSYQTNEFSSQASERVYSKGLYAFFRKVFGLMSLGLLITFGVAFATAVYCYNNTDFFIAFSSQYVFLSVAQIAVVLVLTFLMNKLSAPVLTFFFLAYSVLTGLTFTSILLAYDASSIIYALIATSLFFAILTFVGFVNKRDLTNAGTILFVALFTSIIFSFVNFLFIHSSTMDLIISIVLIFIFAGITIYDVNRLRDVYIQTENQLDDSSFKKIVIWGALSLYLDFINLFLNILRVFSDDN